MQKYKIKFQKKTQNFITSFTVQLFSNIEQTNAMMKFMESDNIEKYNIGNILLWDDKYIIVGTPFNYLDIIDFQQTIKVGIINNVKNIRNINTDKDEEINDIITYNISPRIEDPQYGSSFIMRDNKGKIQYIRPTKVEEKLNYNFDHKIKHFNDLLDNEKLEHLFISTRFYFSYSMVSYFIPLCTAILGHLLKKNAIHDNKILYIVALGFYVTYAAFGIWFKGCVYDINDETHTKRNCTKIMMYLCLILKICANSLISYAYCFSNKTGIIFVSMLIGIYFIHLNITYIIYCCQIKFLLRTYWLSFLFYQISRFCILLFFIISILLKVNHVEIYIYSSILCLVLVYMFMASYFNILKKKIVYNNNLQAIFNYPMEWMNLFCCWCREPKDLIQEIDFKFCVCDSFFFICLQILGWIILIILIIFATILSCFRAAVFGQNQEGGTTREEARENKNKVCEIF